MEIDIQIDTETWILLWRLTYRLIQKQDIVMEIDLQIDTETGYCYGD